LSSERHRRASAIFLEACDLDPPERARFLDQACGADLELRREVEDLLAADADPPALLDAGALGLDLPGPSAAGESEEPAAGAGLPERIGGYCIVRRIGEGGMGAVYEAVQENPHRTVALKVIAPGNASAWHLRRFEHEAYLLGQLQHHR